MTKGIEMTTRSPVAVVLITVAACCSGCIGIEVDWRAGTRPIDHQSLRMLLDLQEAKEKGLISDSTFNEQRELLESSLQ